MLKKKRERLCRRYVSELILIPPNYIKLKKNQNTGNRLRVIIRLSRMIAIEKHHPQFLAACSSFYESNEQSGARRTDTALLFHRARAFRLSNRRHFARAFPRGKPDGRPRVGSRPPRPFLVDLDLHLDLDSAAARLISRSRFSSPRAVKPRTCFGKRIRHFHILASVCDTVTL